MADTPPPRQVGPAPGHGATRARRLVRLADARLYLCTPRRPDLPGFLGAVLGGDSSTRTSSAGTSSAGTSRGGEPGGGGPGGGGPGGGEPGGGGPGSGAAGVDIVQLREKGLEWSEETAALALVRDSSCEHGALAGANDRADLAAYTGVDILHVGQDDIPPAVARRLLGPDVLIGRSTHDPRQLAEALEDPDVDYFCVGPVWATPTKQGRPGIGFGLPRLAARLAPPFVDGAKPWFVTGGVDEATLDAVLDTGARRVVVVRGITTAADPGRAAASLAARLREACGARKAG